MAFNLGFDFGSTTSVLSYYDIDNDTLQTINLDLGRPYIPSKISHDNMLGKKKFGAAAMKDIGKSTATVYEAFKTLLNNDIDDEVVIKGGYDSENTPKAIAKEFIDMVLRRVMADHNESQIDNLCIGVPENWGKSVRTVKSSNSIKQAMGTKRLTEILSSLDYIKKFEVVFEPEAASAFFAYNYNLKKKSKGLKLSGDLLIIDYGGGSLDITLSKVDTLPDGKMEISLSDSEGLGENRDGLIGSAGIRYIEALIEKAAKRAEISKEELYSPDCRSSLSKIRSEVEKNLRDGRDEIEEVFEGINTKNAQELEEIGEYPFCEDLELKNVKTKKRYSFVILFGDLFYTYNEVIKPDLDTTIDTILARNSDVDIESENFRIGIVGGFSNFYFVKKQIWDKFRISNYNDPHVEGLLTNPEEQEKAISLGAALLANDIIEVCTTSEFAIGVFTQEDINGHRNVPIPHFAIEYRQEIEYGKVYYSMMLGSDREQIIMSHNGTIDQLIIMRDKDDRHIMVLSPNPNEGKKLRNVINYKAQVGFSISEDNTITVHIREVEDIGFGEIKEISVRTISLSDYDSLFTNYTVPVGSGYPFSEWLEMVKKGECPRR